MDFILNEADTETDSLKFDSDEDEMECDSTPLSEDEDFLDDDTCYKEDIEHGLSFYRTFDNKEEFSNFEFSIYQSYLLLKIEKQLTFIAFQRIKKEP